MAITAAPDKTLVVVAMIAFCVAGASSAAYRQAAPATQGAQESLEQILHRATDYLKADKLPDAKKEIKRAQKLQKDSPEVNLLLAVVYKREGKPKDAIKYVKQSIKLRQNYADAHHLLGVLLYENGDVAGALKEIETAIDQGARYPGVYVAKGDIKVRASDYDSAVEAFEEALRLAPEGPDAPLLRERVGALKTVIEFRSHNNDPSYKRPVLLNSPRPEYTAKARLKREQGVVKMAVLVDDKGYPSSMMIFSHLRYGLDEEAIKAVRNIRFKPATKDGKPVPFWLSIEVEFNIR